ncbi:MAG: type II toxin-antitoxin system HicB family antitoxin [Nostoc sp. DedVER02]|uniref:type II toxin-antitoxin system HicB family antitoxin n=1 Tax=unclassified Nostoc TaxID=2593658 RepID=UPI002AD58D17|nr:MULTISPECIES: type II toxin-antitoxin system HicB family antitoxin [unclassified Nostoc]MDZ7986369.1 type II toxin-antitoxin system HicB family antitoxin [Nostoc sp. DedVER02]MDZ8112759.1 type II toxin-antitoxin system HicB family antitoxin [Nostoc sp. DedVER01b]
MRYTVVIEKGETSYSAYVPDLPGCVAVGETLEEVKLMIAEAIEFHLEGMLEDNLPIPQPTSIAHEVEVAKELFFSSTKSVNNFT